MSDELTERMNEVAAQAKDRATAHTPGPWAFGEGLDPGEMAVRSDSGHWVCLCFDAQPKDQNCEANGKLIAAAPELLAALQAISSNPYIDLGDLVYKVRESEGEGWEGKAVKQWSDACQLIESAIAKATGKELR